MSVPAQKINQESSLVEPGQIRDNVVIVPRLSSETNVSCNENFEGVKAVQTVGGTSSPTS